MDRPFIEFKIKKKTNFDGLRSLGKLLTITESYLAKKTRQAVLQPITALSKHQTSNSSKYKQQNKQPIQRWELNYVQKTYFL